jgi:arsenate reductase
MTEVSIYHNPRCSKSRQTLQLLQERGIKPEIILYLENAPDKQTITSLLALLGLSARQLMRKGEAEYKALKLNDETLSEDDLVTAMTLHPRLIERPIILANGKAAIGRPPENVLEIL